MSLRGVFCRSDRDCTTSNAAFITQLYVIFVPFFLVLLFKQRIRIVSWLSALLAGGGVLLLSGGGELRLASGDLLELGGAIFWSLHFIVVDRALKHQDLLLFSFLQYAICGFLNLALGLALEREFLPGIQTAWWTVAYVGIFSIGVAFNLRSYGQKYTQPTEATLLNSLEGVFAATLGYVFLGEILQGKQLVGCTLILSAVLLSQLYGNVQTEVVMEPLS